MTNPYQVTRDFESAIAEYTGSKYAVAVNSCTNALLIACRYVFTHLDGIDDDLHIPYVTIPKRTYVSVPMVIKQALGGVQFEDLEWLGEYQLKPYPIWDSAKLLTSGMYRPGTFQCISLHWAKTLNLGQGGVILHDNEEADEWLRRARFDGRKEGVKPKDDHGLIMGYHCYLSPGDAADALVRLSILPKHNKPLPDDGYPDLSTFKIFN